MGQGISENKRIGWLVAVIAALLVMILFLCMSVKEITVTGNERYSSEHIE